MGKNKRCDCAVDLLDLQLEVNIHSVPLLVESFVVFIALIHAFWGSQYFIPLSVFFYL